MADRYFLAAAPANDRALLAGAEAQHLVRVMRAGVGDLVVVFDGSGTEYVARIERLRRDEVELAILEQRPVDRELPLAIVLGVALPKGDRQRWLVEKCVELGVARIVPLVCERSVAQPGEAARERLFRYVVEASKQCGRNQLLKIAPAAALATFVHQDAGGQVLRLVAHRDAQHGESSRLRDILAPHAGGAWESVWLAVGPEGGFTPQEIATLQVHDWQAVSLGPRVLRTETAAIMLAAAVAVVLG